MLPVTPGIRVLFELLCTCITDFAPADAGQNLECIYACARALKKCVTRIQFSGCGFVRYFIRCASCEEAHGNSLFAGCERERTVFF